MAIASTSKRKIRNLIIGFTIICPIIVAIALLPFLKYHRYAAFQAVLYSIVAAAVACNLYRCLKLAGSVGMLAPIASVGGWFVVGIFGGIAEIIQLLASEQKSEADLQVGIYYLTALVFALFALESLMRKMLANAPPK